ncbi:MAG: GNAT family N-acetyltransferase, partial [Pseudomonadota bacterium]
MTDEIQTDRLTLRPPQASDAPRIAQLMSVKDIPWNLGRAPWPYGLQDAEMWIEAAIRSHASKTEYPFVLIHSQHGLIGSSGMMVLT